jgi:hypothetical protein
MYDRGALGGEGNGVLVEVEAEVAEEGTLLRGATNGCVPWKR